jgi:hypothetical protein
MNKNHKARRMAAHKAKETTTFVIPRTIPGGGMGSYQQEICVKHAPRLSKGIPKVGASAPKICAAINRG